jgi:hypothetical protein
MTSSEITERMRVLLDAACALKRDEITQPQYDQIAYLGSWDTFHGTPHDQFVAQAFDREAFVRGDGLS